MAQKVLVDAVIFAEMLERLGEDARIFTQYGGLHEAKGTREGHEKAVANFDHATKIKTLIQTVKSAKFEPYTDILERMIDQSYTRCDNPKAIVATTGFLQGLYRERRQDHPMADLDSWRELIGGSWTGLTIYLAADTLVTGVVVCGEGSRVLELARAHHGE